MEQNCIFCKIIRGDIPAAKMYEDDKMLIFKDIDPKAKLHYLAIPKHHFATLADMNNEDKNYMGEMLFKISQLSTELGLEKGYRLIINQGQDAGQTVFHLHIHILGGQELPFCDMRK